MYNRFVVLYFIAVFKGLRQEFESRLPLQMTTFCGLFLCFIPYLVSIFAKMTVFYPFLSLLCAVLCALLGKILGRNKLFNSFCLCLVLHVGICFKGYRTSFNMSYPFLYNKKLNVLLLTSCYKCMS